MRQWREWDLSFGPVSGAAGTTTIITVAPQVDFRGEKVIAIDTATPPGTGTRIMQLMVGQRMQRPTSNGSTSSVFFGPGVLGNGVRWDTCRQGDVIAITISFVQACTFDMSVFGSALV